MLQSPNDRRNTLNLLEIRKKIHWNLHQHTHLSDEVQFSPSTKATATFLYFVFVYNAQVTKADVDTVGSLNTLLGY
jgi:hypothetical protein